MDGWDGHASEARKLGHISTNGLVQCSRLVVWCKDNICWSGVRITYGGLVLCSHFMVWCKDNIKWSGAMFTFHGLVQG